MGKTENSSGEVTVTNGSDKDDGSKDGQPSELIIQVQDGDIDPKCIPPSDLRWKVDGGFDVVS